MRELFIARKRLYRIGEARRGIAGVVASPPLFPTRSEVRGWGSALSASEGDPRLLKNGRVYSVYPSQKFLLK